jgi:PAS domain S-box-containing protein
MSKDKRVVQEHQPTGQILNEQCELLRKLVDSVPAHLAFEDSQLRYRFTNKTYEKWFGHPLSEIVGKPVREILGDETYRLIQNHVEAVLSGQTVRFDMLVPLKDAGDRHLEAMYTPDFGPQGDVRGFFVFAYYSLTLLAEGKQRLIRSGQVDDIVDTLLEMGEIAQQALKEMRLLVYELRPPMLEQEGLLGALHQRLAAVEKRAGIEARLLAEDIVDLPAPIEEGLYRIAQEALNNSLKHAAATSVTVRLVTDDQGLVLEIVDNGRGIDLRAEPNHQGGIGLASMRERVVRLDGSLEIRSTPGKGTIMLVRLPHMEGSNE